MSALSISKIECRLKALEDKYLNKKYARLTILGFFRSNDKRRDWIAHCACDCGKEKDILLNSIQKGSTTSCGCFRLEQVVKGSVKHGLSKSKWAKCRFSMIQRCYNPNNKRFKHYGGRITPGPITVCERWLNKEMGLLNFIADLSPKPEPAHLYSLDRIDNDGPYEPSNCRWATHKEQNNNQSKKKQYKECQRCGKKFSRNPAALATAKYCTKKCADMPVTQVQISCLECNILFMIQPCKIGKRKFCNKECTIIYRRKHPEAYINIWMANLEKAHASEKHMLFT